MNDERITAPRRFVSDAAFHFGVAERLLRSARRSGAKGDFVLERLEGDARDLRRLTRQAEKGQTA